MRLLVARPAVVALCLLPFGYGFRETVYIGWVGLRGAVPIVLATMPVLAGAPGAGQIFHAVFFVVVVSGLVPGGTVAWASRRLPLARRPTAPAACWPLCSTRSPTSSARCSCCTTSWV